MIKARDEKKTNTIQNRMNEKKDEIKNKENKTCSNTIPVRVK